ncbi:MAG: hypothetical protein Q8Q05_02885 [bacterium]|nr:hypothetical protein [bacterium]
MDEQILPYDILRFDYKERLDDRFLATHLHRFEMFSQPVALVVLIEIVNPWHPSSELGQKILNALVREFSKSEALSYLARFEIALKQANRAVQEALSQTESPVSCVAVLLESDQIHCAGIGSAKLGLLRRGKLATILGSKSTSADTFAAVTSGDMNENDWLLIANSTFYSNLAGLDNQVWLTDDVAEIGTEINQLDQLDRDQKLAGVLLRFNPLRPPSNQTFFWGEARAPKQNFPQFTWPKMNLGPAASLVNLLGALVSQLVGKAIKTFSTKTRQNSNSRFPKLQRRFLPIAISLIIIVAAVWGYRQSNQDQPAQTEQATLLAELENLRAEQLLDGLTEKFTLGGYESLDDSAKSTLTSLLNNQKIFLTELPTATTRAPSDIVALEILNNQPLLIDSQGQIWTYNGSLLTQLTQRTPIANPVSLTAFGPTNIIASDTAGNIWRLDGSPNQPIALTQAGAHINEVKLVEHFQGNLYLINLATRITSRINNFSDNLNGIAVYNKAENLVGLTTPSDIAINGKVLVADTNGLVVEFARNTPSTVKFQLPTVDGAVKIATSDSIALTIISSGRALYLIDNTNTLIGTIFLASSAKISDIVLDPTSPTKFWLASGEELYSIQFSVEASA